MSAETEIIKQLKSIDESINRFSTCFHADFDGITIHQTLEDIKVINNEIRNIAGLGMPDNVKKLLSQGIDLDTIYSPYKNTMATVLEINPATIALSDPTLRGAIGPDKEMSLYEFQKTLRKDPRWQYTNNARENVFQSVNKVLQDFGFQG